MPTDRYYDEIDEYVYKGVLERKDNLRKSLVNKFDSMTLEQKVEFFVNAYVENRVSKQG